MVAIAHDNSQCYYLVMNLKKYMEEMPISILAADLGVSPAVVYQWMKGIRPVPIRRCHRVVEATGGLVTLKDLRPNDWHLIWPELVDQEAQ